MYCDSPELLPDNRYKIQRAAKHQAIVYLTTMDLSSKSESIARLNLYKKDKHFETVHSQAKQRIRLVKRWNIKPGERILEIGCGQGDCTAVLATAVGATGHVVAIDPGPPDYGEILNQYDWLTAEADLIYGLIKVLLGRSLKHNLTSQNPPSDHGSLGSTTVPSTTLESFPPTSPCLTLRSWPTASGT